jgi:hypothetical protein
MTIPVDERRLMIARKRPQLRVSFKMPRTSSADGIGQQLRTT